MAKYLSHFPKPFLDDIVRGRCVPFVGAGFSRNAEVPLGIKMPLWDELGRALANLLPGYQYIGALDAFSAYSHEYSRTKLVEWLAENLLVNKAQPGSTHKAFCELPFEVVCTTNLEFLLERGYQNAGRYCHPIIEEDQVAVGTMDPGVTLFKLHGDLHHPNRLIVTEEDYDGFIERYPLLATYLANLLISKTAFFVGYSLDDPDFRHVWQVIRDRLGRLRRMAYTIAVSPSAHDVARFERRGVKVITLPGRLTDYPAILENAFAELGEYWSTAVIEGSTSTLEEPLVELSLPREAKSRLCFFGIPFRLQSFYSSTIFPIVEKYGFTPVTANMIISPGDNVTAKITALIDRSEVVVIDMSSQNTLLELRMALSKGLGERKLLPVIEEGIDVPTEITGLLYITRPKHLHTGIDTFLSDMDKWFQRASEQLHVAFEEEPQRLLQKREYRAAVISAMTLLENELRGYLDMEQFGATSRPPSMLQLIRQAVNQEVIDQQMEAQIRGWITVRNRLVHSTEGVSPRIAQAIVRGVSEIVRDLHSRGLA